ncbi:hypothetical protein [Sphingobacterium siyangense]|uniref:hypothetical protein n=1 Tax=Sphingobacterium siyangense TaxID=459529 RepID=UPI003C7435F0
MKNLLILFTLFLGLGTVKAQAKKAVAKPAVTKEQPTTYVEEKSSTQIKGPTKLETITYINNIVKNIKYYSEDNAPKINVTSSISRTYGGVILEGCNLVITSLWERKGTTKLGSSQSKGQEIVTIPIDKVERITQGMNFIKFSYYQGEDKIKIRSKVEEENYSKIDTFDEQFESDYTLIGSENQEVFNNLGKAFNHLRKLCGAPEPISFD